MKQAFTFLTVLSLFCLAAQPGAFSRCLVPSTCLPDANDCTLAAEVPPAHNCNLEVQVSIEDITCFGKDNGVIEITSITGGMPPYVVTLTGNNTTWEGVYFDELPPGNHELLVIDALGCELALTVGVLEPMPIFIEIFPGNDPNELVTKLGAELQLVTAYSALYPKFRWKPTNAVDCYDCPSPFSKLVDDATLTVIMTDTFGCTVSDTVHISVEKDRSVAIPNAFSPNEDGVNDLFLVLSENPAVKYVKSLKVFSRWGELLFEYYNFMPSQYAFGWDGTYQGKPAQAGGYVWQVEIDYLDGVTLPFEGVVQLIR